MKPILTVLMFILSLFFVQPTFALEWYEGGTLHKKSGADWNVAQNRNRMATSVDFIATALPEFTKKYMLGPDEYILKAKATQLNICITEATKEHVADNISVAKLAAICMVLMGFVEK